MNAHELGSFLREYREKRGYNVHEVCEIFLDRYDMQVSEKTIYNWETGQYSVSMPKFLALCEIYKIRDLTPPKESIDLSTFSITGHEQRLLVAYRQNPDLQPVIDKILDL